MSKKTLYFDELCGYTVSAATENGTLSEFGFEKDSNHSIKGNIYKGKIVNILQGMQAAFVDCGLERTCYLSADDAIPNAEEFNDIEFPDLHEGDDVLVQVIKPPIGNKGAKVTLFPSLVGNSVIYLPRTPFIGVSRKIADGELRKNLVFSVRNFIGENEGVVLRAASPYTKRGQIEAEINSLKEVYAKICASFKNAETGAVLYSEVGLLRRVLRDVLCKDVDEIHVGTKRFEKLIENFYTLFPPEKRRPVFLHDTGRDMFDELNLSEQVSQLTDSKVSLENGAFLVIDKCEAMTVIDVNTGSFTGDDSLEQTVYYTNVLAAREIARQVKLRNIGGIVVVDFIDMSSSLHNRTVVEELENALKKNGSRCSVGQMSEFGLVEFTRKREGNSLLSLMCKKCDKCRTGFVKSPKFNVFEMRAKLLNFYAEGQRLALLEVGTEAHTVICGWQAFCDDLKTRMPDMQIYLSLRRSFHEEQIKLIFGQFEINDKMTKLY